MSAYSTLVLGTAGGVNGYWRFGETGPDAIAHSEVDDTNMQGNPNNTPTQGVTGLISADSDKAVQLASASSQYFAATGLAHHTGQDVGDVFTIEAWIKRATVSGAQNALFDNGISSLELYIDATNALGLAQSNTAVTVLSTTTITDTTTAHHVAATKNGSTVKLYIDGVDRTGSVSNTTYTNSTQPWIAGADHNAINNFDGVLDELALYPTELSAATILSHYQTGTVIPTPPITFTQSARW